MVRCPPQNNVGRLHLFTYGRGCSKTYSARLIIIGFNNNNNNQPQRVAWIFITIVIAINYYL